MICIQVLCCGRVSKFWDLFVDDEAVIMPARTVLKDRSEHPHKTKADKNKVSGLSNWNKFILMKRNFAWTHSTKSDNFISYGQYIASYFAGRETETTAKSHLLDEKWWKKGPTCIQEKCGPTERTVKDFGRNHQQICRWQNSPSWSNENNIKSGREKGNIVFIYLSQFTQVLFGSWEISWNISFSVKTVSMLGEVTRPWQTTGREDHNPGKFPGEGECCPEFSVEKCAGRGWTSANAPEAGMITPVIQPTVLKKIENITVIGG